MVEKNIRILVVDDHATVRHSIRAMVDREPDMEVVATAENGREAVEIAQTMQPDVIIMDASMPELDGIRAAGKIKELGLLSQVIILSMHYNSVMVQQARKNGIVGYIVKQQANRELIPAIRVAHSARLSS